MADPTANPPEDPAAKRARLLRELAELDAEQASAAPTAGASFGAVDVNNGDVVGGNKYVLIKSLNVAGEEPEHLRSATRAYIDGMAAMLDDLPLSALEIKQDRSRAEPLRLSDVYVALNTTFKKAPSQSLEEALGPNANDRYVVGVDQGSSSRVRLIDRERRAAEQAPTPALEALSHHPRLTLLGIPGSGKSSFGAHVLLGLARAWQGGGDATEQLGPTWTAGSLLPIRVVLRQFAEAHAATPQPLNGGHLWRFIAEQPPAASAFGQPDRAMKVLQHMARTQGALVLFDGLDECGGEQRRQRVQAAIADFMNGCGDRLRCLVTARPYAFGNKTDERNGRYQLADFDNEQVERFIHGWYAAVAQRGWQLRATAPQLTDELLKAYRRPDLRQFTANPLLLTLTASLHSEGRLPNDRADLYQRTVDLLLAKWNVQADDQKGLPVELAVSGLTRIDQLKPVLQRLAFEVHQENAGASGAAEIGEDRLVRALTPLMAGSRDKAVQAVEYIERRAGLLIGLGDPGIGSDLAGPAAERRFVFPHRTFQEFLAACHLAGQPDQQLLPTAKQLCHHNPTHWSVVLPLVARMAGPSRGAALAADLIAPITNQALQPGQARPAVEGHAALLAGLALQEIGVANLRDNVVCQQVLDQVRTQLLQVMSTPQSQGGLGAAFRVMAGDILAALGDPRFNPSRWQLPADPLLGFVRIEADSQFCIGTREADAQKVKAATGSQPAGDELNSSPTPTEAFYIARYPVTVAQYRAFSQHAGIEPADPDALRAPDTRPFCWISWHEARAYCQWLQHTLAAAPADQSGEVGRLLRQGWQLRLPTELQWEKAARGGRVRQVFSWGDAPDADQANQGDTDLHQTSAVGCFPANDFGLCDMLGNVWEWTSSLWQRPGSEAAARYPACTQDQRFDAWDQETDHRRLVRGGSFLNLRNSARCAYPLPLPARLPQLLLGLPCGVECCPCCWSSGLWSLWARDLSQSDLRRGCGGDFPRAARAARGHIGAIAGPTTHTTSGQAAGTNVALPCPLGGTPHSAGQAAWNLVRGGSFNNNRNNVRCAYYART